jgi:hypothetical protein
MSCLSSSSNALRISLNVEEFYLLGCYRMFSVWYMFMDVSEECTTLRFTLKMVAVHAFEMSVNIYQT